jgi:hypothetical protein
VAVGVGLGVPVGCIGVGVSEICVGVVGALHPIRNARTNPAINVLRPSLYRFTVASFSQGTGAKLPNGLRYRRLGGRREHQFAGIHLKPRKVLENAQTPRRRVHAVLGGLARPRQRRCNVNSVRNFYQLLLDSCLTQGCKMISEGLQPIYHP